MDFYEEIVQKINSGAIENKKELQNEKIKLARKAGLDYIPGDVEILNSGHHIDQEYHNLLRIKTTRTVSGVAVVAAMTSPERCPHGKCIYCPGGVDNNSPQAYTGHEPAALRGEEQQLRSIQRGFQQAEAD